MSPGVGWHVTGEIYRRYIGPLGVGACRSLDRISPEIGKTEMFLQVDCYSSSQIVPITKSSSHTQYNRLVRIPWRIGAKHMPRYQISFGKG